MPANNTPSRTKQRISILREHLIRKQIYPTSQEKSEHSRRLASFPRVSQKQRPTQAPAPPTRELVIRHQKTPFYEDISYEHVENS